MASNAEHRPPSISQSLWVGGLSLADFEIPSQKTEIATVTSAVTKVALDMADAVTSLPNGGDDVEVLSSAQSYDDHALGSIVDQVLAGWGQGDNDLNFADRKTLWPVIDQDSFRPAASAEQRVQDNIAAIKLVQRLSQDKSRPTDGEMVQLLKYSGWGGVARVFSPDGSAPHTFSALRDELKSITTEEEFAAMQSSVNTAFYTDPCVVQALWRIVARLGFKGGRVLEPAAGVGHIIAGMPLAMVAKSDITAVEIDPVSARILEANFAPYGLQVQACGIEDAKLPIGFYDLVVANVPFGKYKSKDVSKAPYADWSIHNYFLGKGLELIRPGGLMVVITTRQSLDSTSDKHRKWLSAHAELLGAFRLPTMAFETFANTQAVTDILVFKRREMPDFATTSSWVHTAEAKEDMFKVGETVSKMSYCRATGRSYEKKAVLNSYYLRQPNHILGRLQWQSGQFGADAQPVFDGSIEQLGDALEQLIDNELPVAVYQPREGGVDPGLASAMTRYANVHQAQPGSFLLHDSKLCIAEGEEVLDVDALYTGTTRKRLLGMMDVRDAALATIEFQARSKDDLELARLQKVLNATYDNFVAKMGFLSTTANSRVMRGDPNWPLMLALEIWDDEEGAAVKADIFFKRTVGEVELPARVETAKDAMLLSLSIYGQIVLKDMALRMGKPVMEVVNELKAHGTAYRDPILARWVPADEYLSGHIRDKITQARAAGPSYAANLAALEAVLPGDLGPAEVEARLGAPWIPTDVIEDFAKGLVKDTSNSVSVGYDATTATWSIKASGNMHWVGDQTLQRTKWGTEKRCALQLLEAALNQQPPTVMMTIDDKSVVDAQATLSAREKWQAIRDHFRSWVYRDDARRDRLLRLYNDTFNQIVPRRFDGSHLQLPGMSAVVVPYPHQKDAIWRIMVGGNTLLAHCVGAGKTLTMLAAGMELRRLGKARKPLHVVQGSTLEQYCAEALRLYPQSKVLMATKADLSGDRRRTFVARVATGDWDAVVMTQATFERLMLSPTVQRDFIDGLLEEARMSMMLTSDSGARKSIKEIERRMKDYEAKLERLVEGGKADETAVWFDDLGVDWLMIDESHAYKNLAKITKMPRIAGIPNTASQRAFDVFMKTQVIMSMRGGKEDGVVMATATPLSNSLCEMHTFQMYLQPQTLKRYGIYEFDAWAASFGESVTGIELAPDGSGFRTNTRFSKFCNLAELMAIFRGVADIRTKRMLKLPTPEIEGGKPQVMVAQPSDVLKEIITGLVERADKIRNREVRPEHDNMLAVTNDGRRAAIDVRMIDPHLSFDPKGKLALVAGNVHRIWKEGIQRRSTQLVFSDLGTSGASGFSVYDEVKRLLVEYGIPEAEIEFVQDHSSGSARTKLFKRFRDGAVRVLFGSTSMLGTGTNIQTRLKAIHQIDAPWRPSDVEQRDGRGGRPGNECETIELWRYVTEASFDSYSWNLLDLKARFIEQVMTAEQGLRTVEDISMTALSYAEIKAIASGNPLVLEKAQVDAAVQTLSLKFDHYEQDRWKMGRRKADLVRRLKWIDDNMQLAEEIALEAAAITATMAFKPLLATAAAAMAGMNNNCLAVGQALRAVSKAIGTDARLAQLGRFFLETSLWGGTLDLVLVEPTLGVRARVERPPMHEPAGVGTATYEAFKGFASLPGDLRLEYGHKTEELAGIQTMLAQDFEFRDELAAARKRQREIEAELDLDKATAGTSAMETDAA